MKNIELFEKIKKYLSDRDEIIFAYLFGSSLEVDNPNDIDIGIFINEEQVHEEEAFEYSIKLSVELAYRVSKEIDLVVMNFVSLGLLKNIIQGKLILSKNDILKDEFIEKITREYMDYYYYSKEFLKEVLHG